jgi:hypothetical protein
MTASRVRLVSTAWVLALLVIVLATWAAMTDPRAATNWEEVVLVVGFGFGFTSVGAILVTRRPREPVGRMALLIGLIAIAATGLRSIAIVLDGAPGPIPVTGAAAAAVSSQLGNAVLMSAGLLLVRYPAGLERDRLSTIANGLFLLALGCTLIVTFAPGTIQADWIQPTRNPLGVDALDRRTAETVASAGLFLYVAGLAVTAVVLTCRYRRSGPVVRAQIRWVAAAGALPVVLFPGLFIGPSWLWSAWFLSVALLPIAIGIAILRYRLYDIDRIISRTLSWAVVTGVLVAVFAGAVIALQTVLAPVTDNNTIAVAASTLLAFALFQPIRRGVQRAVDRRFNRARYDAQRIVDAFAGAIRSQLDLEQLRGALVDTATRSVQPHGAAVWLRAGGRR